MFGGERLKLLVGCFLFLLTVACAPAGGIRPTMFSMPPTYLSSFPLNQLTETEMMVKAGPPDDVITYGGKRALVYRFGEMAGKRSFTFLLDEDLIVDVVYNDNGPYNGTTAQQYQSTK